MTSSLSLDRLILVDLMHNRGSTPHQIRHRLNGQPPKQVHVSLSRLITGGHIAARGDRLEITRSGLKSLYREVIS